MTSRGVVGELMMVGVAVVVDGIVVAGVSDCDAEGAALGVLEAVGDVAGAPGVVPPLTIETITATTNTAMTTALIGCRLAAVATLAKNPGLLVEIGIGGGRCVAH